ncbi:MAG TPA: NADH-quinone oxidoreductase subunit NuoH [Terriglobia bacterium]|jgi:NADH-quinone oxidoreductase subunit H|nr:NADH-quinone oxidoreductase subunit NuoH [Terriglobia bacterium]
MIGYLTSRDFIILIIKIVVIFGAVMNVVGLLSWVERKVMARVQMRPGPTRVGPFGLLQPLADLLKFVFKEEVIPTQANTFLYIAAPLISLIPAFLTFAVVPFGPSLQVTDLSVGLLFVFALTSLGVYGIALGGWSSNSKYPLLGAMRSSAQMISYELSLTLSVVGVVLIANTLSLRELVISQNSTWAGFIPRWNIFLQPIPFVVYVVSGVAETNRLPFDLAESEQELVAGWHTEYSSMKFLMFMMAEYANLIAVSSVATILFLGGWNGPMFGPQWLQMALPIVWFVLKIGLFVFFYVLLRSTIPRFRYDQLMRFGWKVLFPLSLANIVVTSFVVAIT